MNSKPKPIRYTAFISHVEWFFYYLVIPKSLHFSHDPIFHEQINIADYHEKIQNAVFFLEILELRNSKTIPISFQATIDLMRLPLLERDPYLSSEDYNKLMLLSITRIVNMLCDTGDNSKLGRSIGRILQQLNLKDYGLITEVRHTATHKTLPNLQVTKAAVQSLYQFLLVSYWEKQFEACAPFLRENQTRVYGFLEKMVKEEPQVFRTELSDWNDVAMILNRKKGKHKAKEMDLLGVKEKDQGKNKLKRALKILDYLNKMIFYLRKFELRQDYVKSGFESDLSSLTYLLRNTDRLLFQRFAFLQYRLKQIIHYKELCEEFGRIIKGIESKIPSCVKDLDRKDQSKKAKRTMEEANIDVDNDEELKNEVRKEVKIEKIDEQIKDQWVPEPLAKNFMSKLYL